MSDVFVDSSYSHEIIIVDDGSSDNSFEVIKKMALFNPNIKGIRLSRNMGHQAALDCGLRHATGDAIINFEVCFSDFQVFCRRVNFSLTFWLYYF